MEEGPPTQETGKDKKRLSPGVSRRNQPCQDLDFRTPDLQNSKLINLCGFNLLHLWQLLTGNPTGPWAPA